MENLIKSLVQAQKEFPIIKKNRKSHQHDYADLAAIVESTRPILAKNNLCHVFTILKSDNGVDLVTALFHESGEKIESVYPLGDLSQMKDKDAGIRISYAKRYSLKSILAVEEEKDPHDNGWGSASDLNSKAPSRPSPQRQKPNPRNHAPSASSAPEKANTAAPKNQANTAKSLQRLWLKFQEKGFDKAKASEAVKLEFDKTSTELTEGEIEKMINLVDSVGLAILDQGPE